MQTEFQQKLKALSDKIELEFNKKHISKPDLIYHYTDAKGLKGILESKVIYLTNSNYLNDSSELEYGWKITEKKLKNYIEKNKQDNAIIFSVLQKLIDEGNPIKNDCEVFIASFCKKDDLLNQWRGYGSTDGAFSIGIKTSKLEIKEHLYKVEYNKTQQKRHIKNFLGSWISLIKKFNTPMTKENAIKTAAYFYYNTCRASIVFKNDAFENEQEFRLYKDFFREEKEEYKDLKFRIRSGLILPYLEVPLYDTSNENNKIPTDSITYKNNKIPIDSITYALSKDSALTEKSIKLLLLKHGYDLKEIDIKESKVPLRFK